MPCKSTSVAYSEVPSQFACHGTPYTGFDAGLAAVAGVLLVAAGIAMRKAVRRSI